MILKNGPLQEISIAGDNHGDIIQQILIDGAELKRQLPRLLPPIELYVGHREDLQKIYDYLLNGKDIIIITGLGGIGKTEFSRYFGKTYFSERSYYLDFKRSILDTFLDQLDIFDAQPNKYDTFSEVMRWLGRILNKDDLLVIDNVTNLEGINEVFRLPCHVLLTTRLLCESVNISTCIKYDFPLLTEPECSVLFQAYYHMRNDHCFTAEEQKAVLKIVELVNCHTLTLELLAKTCSKSCMNVSKLLQRLEKYGFDLGGIEEKVSRNNSVTNRTFLEHMKKLFDITDILAIKGMRSVLLRLSVLKLNGLKIQYVNKLLQLPDLNLLYELADLGWINIRQEQVFMHQVVSEVIKSYLNPDAAHLKNLLKVLDTELSDNIKDAGEFEPYASQAEAILRYLADSHNRTICSISAKLGKIFYYTGKWQESYDYFTRCIMDYKKCFFPKQRYLAEIYFNMGRTCKALAQYDTAREYYDKSLRILKRCSDENAPVFAELYSNMAIVYYQQDNDYESAIRLLKLALDIQEKAHDIDRHLIAATYNYLGLAYRAVGDYKTALYYLEEKALPVQREYYGENSYIVAETTNNLAGVYRRLADYTHALGLYQTALKIRKENLSPKHPDLATSYNNIGMLYRDIKEWDISIKYCSQAVSIFEESLGKEHPYTAAAYLNIARAYLGANDFSAAVHYALLAKEIKEKKYPSTNKSLLSTYELLAQAYEGLGITADINFFKYDV